MKLSQRQIERTVNQIDAQAIPQNHPLVPELTEMFGDHTFFLDDDGLGIVEPTKESAEAAQIVMLADWADAQHTRLATHEPEPTDVVIELAPDDSNGAA